MGDLMPVFVRSGRHPYVVALAIGLVIAHAYGLLIEPASTSIDAELGMLQRVLFSVCSGTGAVLILTGLWWRGDPFRALYLEQAGHVLVGAGAAAYVAVLCLTTTFATSGLITTIASCIALGALARVVQISRDIRDVRNAGGAAGES